MFYLNKNFNKDDFLQFQVLKSMVNTYPLMPFLEKKQKKYQKKQIREKKPIKGKNLYLLIIKLKKPYLLK